jgi:hypothetical protein
MRLEFCLQIFFGTSSAKKAPDEKVDGAESHTFRPTQRGSARSTWRQNMADEQAENRGAPDRWTAFNASPYLGAEIMMIRSGGRTNCTRFA